MSEDVQNYSDEDFAKEECPEENPEQFASKDDMTRSFNKAVDHHLQGLMEFKRLFKMIDVRKGPGYAQLQRLVAEILRPEIRVAGPVEDMAKALKSFDETV